MATNTENPDPKSPPKTLDLSVPPADKPHQLTDAPTQPSSSRNEARPSKPSVSAVPEHDNDAPLTDVQKKIRRAERFGISVQLSEHEKRNSRAERFGTGSPGTEAYKKSEELKRKARAERFGIPGSPAESDEEAKKKARITRFAPLSKADPLEEDKRKARALRFSNPPPSSLSKINGEGDIEPNAALTGKPGGEA